MASSVSGKVAFVTGGASGIREALTTELVRGGAEVWIADRQTGRPDDLAQRLGNGGAKVHAIELDVRDFSSFERGVAEAVEQSGRIDYLFNNAGIGVSGEIDSYTLDDWTDVFDVKPPESHFSRRNRAFAGKVRVTVSKSGISACLGTPDRDDLTVLHTQT